MTLDEVIYRVKRWVFSGEPPKSLSPLPEKNLAVDRIQIESRMIDPLYFGIQCLQVNLQGSNLLNASYFSFHSSSQPHGSMNKSSWPHSSFTFEKHLHGCLVQSTSCSSQLFHSFYRMGMDIWPWACPKDRQPRLSPENLNLELSHTRKGIRAESPQRQYHEETTW